MALQQANYEKEAPRALRLTGVECPLELRRSRRATRFSLKVSYTERVAILTLPQHVSTEEASGFLARHMDWLKRQIDRLPKPIPFSSGSILPLRGDAPTLHFAGPGRHQGVAFLPH